MQAIKIMFVCDSGLVGSIMGAKVLRERIRHEQLPATVHTCRAQEVPDDTRFLVGPRRIVSTVQTHATCQRFGVDALLVAEAYDELIQAVRNERIRHD
ncbi:hypothetical protein D3D03_05705 [Exiguobacterium sp. RIT452]|uniref:hypothetical protein n=1 Tax=Exiguobacterium sp. RIT452 TaxID=2315552 RepID=UPI000E72A843|nr:hypothetical protein [Exiguobacterium sp. RIT452]RJP00281.1 hypothetical protein D3D03_05705 [Exiguobacterium sp. RIT452]